MPRVQSALHVIESPPARGWDGSAVFVRTKKGEPLRARPKYKRENMLFGLLA